MDFINQHDSFFLQVFRMFGRALEGQIESCTEVSDNMETPAALEIEQLQKQLVEKDEEIRKLIEEKTNDSQSHQVVKLQLKQQSKVIGEKEEKIAELGNELKAQKTENQQQDKKLVEKDERMTEIENKLEDEKLKNAQIQNLQVLQNEEQEKQQKEKDGKMTEIENENTKLEDQLSQRDSTIKAQRKHIDELEKKLSLMCPSTDESEEKQPGPIISSSPSDTSNTHSTKKRHPSVGKKSTLLNMRSGDRRSMPNFDPAAVPQSHAKKTENPSSLPIINDQNYPPLAARNNHGQTSAIPSSIASPISNSWTASSTASSPISSHPAASPSVANSSPNSHLATNVLDKVVYYTDSNTHTLPRILREKMDEIRNESGKVPKLEQVRAYTMQKAHKLIQTNNHENALVVINIMTNNARRRESPASVCDIQEEIIWMLKSETAPQNIVFIESPPSIKFDIASYNQSTQALCKRMKVRFSKTLICKGHLNHDGFHIRFEHQHLMQKTVAAAILNVDPFKAFKLSPNSRGLLGPHPTA